MNYVRKLGFEETPDYDFLRELFTKVLKTLGEQEDGVYDWMALNGGKGWEAGSVSTRCAYLHQRLILGSDSKMVHPVLTMAATDVIVNMVIADPHVKPVTQPRMVLC